MTGILLLMLIAAMALIAGILTRMVLRNLPAGLWRKILLGPILLLFMALPVADELVGTIQFTDLCKNAESVRGDLNQARGKRVRVVVASENEAVGGTAIPIYHSRFQFQTVDDAKQIGEYDTYVAKSGWLVRALNLSEAHAPLLIGRPACAPPGRGLFARTYGFTLVN